MSSSAPKVRISLACIACKKRKAKCSGGPPPCQSCRASGTQCVIDESLDGRRKASAKRTFDELTYHKTFIEGLLTYIRTFDHTSLEHLVDLIKADVPLPEIGALIDESLQLSHHGAQAEESLRVLRLDTAEPPNVRRKLEGDHVPESPITPSTSEVGQPRPFEWQARQLGDQETLLAFLKNTSYDEVEDIAKYLRRTSTANLYDGLLQYSTDIEQRESSNAPIASPITARSQDIPSDTSRSLEFSRARNLSVSTLSQYEQYLQNLFYNQNYNDLEAVANTVHRDRSTWHPALKLRFSDPGVESDGSAETSNEEQFFARQDLQEERPPTGSTPNLNRDRLRTDNDPQTGEDFQLSQSSDQEDLSGAASEERGKRTSKRHAVDALSQKMTSLNVPLYQILPLTGIDDSPLARSYTSYRDEARSMLASGISSRELLGDWHTRVDLVFRPRRPSDAHSVCNWAAELSAAFRDDFTMPWVLAHVMMMARFIRWLLIPTEESYNRIPPSMRPTKFQRFIPHNPSADLNPIPAIRDALCIRFRDCVTPLINNSYFHWPYSLDDAVDHDPQADTYQLSEKFEEYVQDFSNWRVSRRLIEAFPEIAGRSDVTFSD